MRAHHFILIGALLLSACKVCGNSKVEDGESCDDGNSVGADGCNPTCTGFEVCGDGLTDSAADEACDDGNTQSGDGCRDDCRGSEVCGDGILDTPAGENCDEGDNNGNSFCRADCTVVQCGDGILDASNGEECDDNNNQNGDGCSQNCQNEAVCGDGIFEQPQEECDDSNLVDGDGCDSNCTITGCPNGVVTAGEQCDDGNEQGGDGCRPNCTIEVCGDGVADIPGEECDDGNTTSGDGCSQTCEAEVGCGNGVVEPPELCDDGNVANGDGCDQNCRNDLPDLTVLADHLLPEISTINIDANDCEFINQCATGTGLRTILEFDTFSANLGPADFQGGPENLPDLYETNACTGLEEWTTYSRFFLRDLNGNQVAAGHKPSFCLIDIFQVDPNAPPLGHSCGFNQGISPGWADVYSRGLACQYIDITDVPAGDYILEVEVNFEQLLEEVDFTNNSASIFVTIP